MNAIKYPLILAVLLLLSCGTDNPKELATEYCRCFNEGLTDEARMKECGEMVKEHKEILAKNPEKSKKYAEEILKCAVFENIP